MFVALSLFLFIFFVIRTTDVVAGLNDEKERVLLDDISYKIQSELYLAYEAHDGYYRRFTLPSNVVSKNYIIEYSDQFIFLSTDKHVVTKRVPDFSGTLGVGENIIEKNDGEIIIS